MTQRERWIIYPLVFLALGTALRDKFMVPEQIRAQEILAASIKCEQIEANKSVANEATASRLTSQQVVVVTPTDDPRIMLATVDVAPNEADEPKIVGRIQVQSATETSAIILGDSIKCEAMLIRELNQISSPPAGEDQEKAEEPAENADVTTSD